MKLQLTRHVSEASKNEWDPKADALGS